MKPLVIYHANCADGFGAAFAAWLKFGEEVEYVPMQYGVGTTVADLNSLYPSLRDYEIYILDFSLPKTEMDWLFDNAKRVVWLDHHKTAFEMWCKEYYPGKLYTQPLVDTASSRADNNDFRHTIILNDNKSGAMIAWEYFHPGKEIPILIKHIDDYDRWQFKLEGTKEFNRALWSYAPWSFEQWKNWVFSMSIVDLLKAEGVAILRAHDANVQSVVNGSTLECRIGYSRTKINPIQNWESFKGLAANCPPHLSSDVGHELANQSGTYGLLWSINKDGKCICSLRSNGDYDVSSIANAFGGGGHKNAAGFEVAIETLLKWIK